MFCPHHDLLSSVFSSVMFHGLSHIAQAGHILQFGKQCKKSTNLTCFLRQSPETTWSSRLESARSTTSARIVLSPALLVWALH